MGAQHSFLTLPSKACLLHRLKAHAEEMVTDERFAKAGERWDMDTPETKEAYYIREIFEGAFRSSRHRVAQT
jgi:hypothetical protein